MAPPAARLHSGPEPTYLISREVRTVNAREHNISHRQTANGADTMLDFDILQPSAENEYALWASLVQNSLTNWI